MNTEIDYLKSRLNYDGSTGVFTWKSKGGPNSSIKVGEKAGGKNKKGYVVFCLILNGKKKNIYAHRVAWIFTYGSWPAGEIDHINGITDDNRIENLRDVSVSENQQNRKNHRLGKLLGTTYCKNSKKWVSQLNIKKKHIYLGHFKTEVEAHNAYQNYLKQKANCN